MKQIFIHIVLFLVLCVNYSTAQNLFTDHKPEYRKWQDDYILDKIEYTKDRTIFYFRFVCKSGKYTNAIFYPPGGEHPWYLKGRDVKKNFDILEIRNVRRNSKLMKTRVRDEAYSVAALDNVGYTVFSCEVHFQRLPNDLTTVDLIEGKGQEYNKNHFNCFNVKLKTWNDKDLGDEKDSDKNVGEFEKKYGIVSVNTKPEIKKDPKPEIKKDPKPEIKKIPEPKPDTIKKIIEPKPEIKKEPKPIESTVVADSESKYPSSSRRLGFSKDIECNELLILDKIQFHDNSTNFKGMIAAEQTLSTLFNYMKKNPNSKIILYGHTDVFGDEEKNIDLSKQRVVKIQRWLSMYGIKGHRIDYEWLGSKEPLVPEGDPINRRVEVKVICGD